MNIFDAAAYLGDKTQPLNIATETAIKVSTVTDWGTLLIPVIITGVISLFVGWFIAKKAGIYAGKYAAEFTQNYEKNKLEADKIQNITKKLKNNIYIINHNIVNIEIFIRNSIKVIESINAKKESVWGYSNMLEYQLNNVDIDLLDIIKEENIKDLIDMLNAYCPIMKNSNPDIFHILTIHRKTINQTNAKIKDIQPITDNMLKGIRIDPELYLHHANILNNISASGLGYSYIIIEALLQELDNLDIKHSFRESTSFKISKEHFDNYIAMNKEEHSS